MPSRLSPVEQDRVRALERHRRVHLHLDWWALDEWLNGDAIAVAGEGAGIRGALLIIPIDTADASARASTASNAAWLRWCALADGAPASQVMRELFERAAPKMTAYGIDAVFCATTHQGWLMPYLVDNAFEPHDEVVTMTRRTDPPSPRARSSATIRNATENDLGALARLDRAAFELEWHYSPDVLGRALLSADRFRVAEMDGAIAGYHFVASADGIAHLTRVAVSPDKQRLGIGSDLLRDALRAARLAGAHTMTLNTQVSNTGAQRLYERFGFDRIGHHLKILRKAL